MSIENCFVLVNWELGCGEAWFRFLWFIEGGVSLAWRVGVSWFGGLFFLKVAFFRVSIIYTYGICVGFVG